MFEWSIIFSKLSLEKVFIIIQERASKKKKITIFLAIKYLYLMSGEIDMVNNFDFLVIVKQQNVIIVRLTFLIIFFGVVRF